MDANVYRFKDFNGPTPQPFNFHIDVTEFDGSAEDEWGHGTRMAGCVAGKIGGTYKFADIIPVKAVLNDGTLQAWNLITALSRIIERQQAIGNPGSVVSMSINFEEEQLIDVINQAGHEPLYPTINRLPRHNVVVIMSSGNLPTAPIGLRLPRRYGGVLTPFVVVGSTDANGHRSDFSSYLDPQGQGLLSLYVMAEQVVVPNIGGGYHHKQGTSEAAAMVAGLAARLLAANIAPANVKSELRLQGTELKGSSWDWDDGFPVARGGMKNQVPCTDPVLPPLPTPTYTHYTGGAGLVFEATANFAAPAAATSTCYDVISHAPAILHTVTVAAP